MKFVSFLFLFLFTAWAQAREGEAALLEVILGKNNHPSKIQNIYPSDAIHTQIQKIHFQLLQQSPFAEFVKIKACGAPQYLTRLFSLTEQQVNQLCANYQSTPPPLVTRGRSALPRTYKVIFTSTAPIAESWTTDYNVTYLVFNQSIQEADLLRKLTHEAAILLDSKAGAYLPSSSNLSCEERSALTNPIVRIAGSILRAFKIENEVLGTNVPVNWNFAIAQAKRFQGLPHTVSARMGLCRPDSLMDLVTTVPKEQTERDFQLLLKRPDLLRSLEIYDLGFAFTGSQFSPRPRMNGGGW